jgi:Protein of unknown function (DUF3341)
MRSIIRPRKAAQQAASGPTTYGLVAEFSDADTLMHATEAARDAGYTQMDAFSPFPIHGMGEALGIKGSRFPWFIFAGAMTGLALAVFLVFWGTYVDYALLINGRPPFNWQSSIPVFFEMTILFTAFATVFGMLIANRLPELYHPLFNLESFRKVTSEGFFLAIEARDPKFDRRLTEQFLRGLHPTVVTEVSN